MTAKNVASSIMIISLLFAVSPARADSTITLKDSKDGSRSLIQVKGGMARMSEPGSQDYMLYDKARDLVIHVDGARGQYTEMDRDTLKQQAAAMGGMRQEMAAQMEQMQAQLQGLPPEQRRMIEQQMGSMMGTPSAAPQPARKVRSEARGRKKVNGFACKQHDLYEGKDKVAEVCIASADDIDVSKSDYETVTAMMAFMRDMEKSAQMMSGQSADSDPLILSGLTGIPVAMKDFRGGEDYSLGGVSTDKLDAALFTDYKRFQKQDMSEMMSPPSR